MDKTQRSDKGIGREIGITSQCSRCGAEIKKAIRVPKKYCWDCKMQLAAMRREKYKKARASAGESSRGHKNP